MKKPNLPVAVLAAALLPWTALALEQKPDTLSLALGPGRDDSSQLTLGLGWDLGWQRSWGPVLATAHAELLASVWRAPDFGGGSQDFGHLGVLPTLRLRLGEGRSSWFAEAGIGLSWHNRRYVTPERQMSTRFNFTDVIGVGRSFGPKGRQELSLRFNHVSNGGYKKPNPGEDFLLVRYATRF